MPGIKLHSDDSATCPMLKAGCYGINWPELYCDFPLNGIVLWCRQILWVREYLAIMSCGSRIQSSVINYIKAWYTNGHNLAINALPPLLSSGHFTSLIYITCDSRSKLMTDWCLLFITAPTEVFELYVVYFKQTLYLQSSPPEIIKLLIGFQSTFNTIPSWPFHWGN